MTDTEFDSFSAHRVPTAEREPALESQRTALIVVDMLNDFCEAGGAMVLPGADRLYGPIRRLGEAVRSHGGKVIWACDRHDSLDDSSFENARRTASQEHGVRRW